MCRMLWQGDSTHDLRWIFLLAVFSQMKASSQRIRFVIQSDCTSSHRVSLTMIRINSRIHSDRWSSAVVHAECFSITSPVHIRFAGQRTRPTVLCTCWMSSDITFQHILWLLSCYCSEGKDGDGGFAIHHHHDSDFFHFCFCASLKMSSWRRYISFGQLATPHFKNGNFMLARTMFFAYSRRFILIFSQCSPKDFAWRIWFMKMRSSSDLYATPIESQYFCISMIHEWTAIFCSSVRPLFFFEEISDWTSSWTSTTLASSIP